RAHRSGQGERRHRVRAGRRAGPGPRRRPMTMAPGAPRSAGDRPGRRPDRRALPLPERKRAERAAARRLARSRTRVALTAEQRAIDPPDRGRRSGGARAAIALAALLCAAALHLAVVEIGVLIGGREPAQRERIEQVVKVEVREPPPPPPPPPPVEDKRPEPPKPEPIVKKTPPPPKRVPAPPPPALAPKGPPPRVVGISLDSTAEGGNGPAFAVGDTRVGEAPDHAPVPKAEPPAASAPPVLDDRPKNKIASRIPVAGVKYTPPKRKMERKPAYPETLKAQGVEGDVTVMVS